MTIKSTPFTFLSWVITSLSLAVAPGLRTSGRKQADPVLRPDARAESIRKGHVAAIEQNTIPARGGRIALINFHPGSVVFFMGVPERPQAIGSQLGHVVEELAQQVFQRIEIGRASCRERV